MRGSWTDPEEALHERQQDQRRCELQRVAGLLDEWYRDNPVVHNALRHVLHGVETETCLITIIKILAAQNAAMLKDMAPITIKKSWPPITIKKS